MTAPCIGARLDVLKGIMAEIETGTEARQGSKEKPPLYVLIGTMVLCVLATIGVMAWQGDESPTDPAGESQKAASKTAGSLFSTQQPANPTAQPKPQ